MKRIKIASLAAAALLLGTLSLLPATAGASGAQQTVHPAVYTYADFHPGEDVPVLIQSDDETLSLWVAGHGGTVSREFDAIDAFQAEMPVEAIRSLDFTDGAEWVSLDAPLVGSSRGGDNVDASALETVYPFAAGAVSAWSDDVTGEGVTVAVVDSGVNPVPDLRGRIAAVRNFSDERTPRDASGHGTWVGGIIAGDDPLGRYLGMAPDAELLSVKVAGRDGSARTGDVVEAFLWIVENKDRYDIDVVNLSMNSAIADSYRRDPLSAAVEHAWLNGIVVVVSAGNNGTAAFAVDHAPANDPYVITVGALDDAGTPARSDDAIAPWSSRGVTVDGYAKPEVTAAGVGIVSTSGGSWTALHRDASGNVIDSRYVRFSGTSASAAVVSGAVALMLDENPNLTPDQVKFRVMATGVAVSGSDAPGVDANEATFTTLMGEANGDAMPNEFIDPETGEVLEDSILWRRILWRRILWRSILWRR